MPQSLHEENKPEVIKMTDAQNYEASGFAKAPRLKDVRDTTALMESVVSDNEEAFKELAK